MEILTKKLGKNTYTFYCKTYENRYNWGHKVQLHRNNWRLSENKITYYNRTWEAFTYQSCMLGAVNVAYNERLKNYIEQYKEAENITRLKAEKKEALKKEYNKTTEAKELLKLKKIIQKANNNHDFKRQSIYDF